MEPIKKYTGPERRQVPSHRVPISLYICAHGRKCRFKADVEVKTNHIHFGPMSMCGFDFRKDAYAHQRSCDSLDVVNNSTERKEDERA